MARLQVVRVDSLDGDTHFVLFESTLSEKRENGEEYDEVEVRATCISGHGMFSGQPSCQRHGKMVSQLQF
jgi:hypothetical protein